ncbi:LysR family transcriptional regulator [uncultured Amnibacterium sp.]|uniref:LysR family transcriptional regulator n=1 Tax=uncultured Amnibacterium sp. TaxID=1631851 RepID=UPI0035CB8168
MDVRRLEVLRELKLRGSVTAVAIATHRTPSAVSQQLKTLEREAGLPLTERSGRGIALTPAGEALARSAGDVAVAIAQAEETWRTYVASPQGRVELALFPTAGRMLLPGLMKAVHQVPGLELVATDVDPVAGDFPALVNDHDIVIAHAVGPTPAWSDGDLVVVPLAEEPLDVALPVGHPLAEAPEVTSVDIAASPWIGVPAHFPTERLYAEIERVAGTQLRIVQRFSDTRVVEALVAAGEGLAVLPRFTSGGRGSGIVLRPLAQLLPTRRIAALMRRETAERPSVRVVVDALRSIAATLGPAERA